MEDMKMYNKLLKMKNCNRLIVCFLKVLLKSSDFADLLVCPFKSMNLIHSVS